ncbi:MAG: hypothetical protein GXY25_07085 [Pirellulaceae bacterium]|mgnify:CR=1 FL=1|nr:hypothetical protein [Thermoguttaceae bacterium]NLZ00285.1 hypothetical protein [Pirellulaceae bacterium]
MIRLLEDQCVSASPAASAESADWRCSPAPPRRPADVSAGSRILQGQRDAIVYKVADTRRELHAAMRLVHDNYVRLGLIQPKKYGLHVAPQHALPTTEVLVAITRQAVVCTMSVIQGDGFQLPLEQIYGEEVALFRIRRQRVAEIGSLASVSAECEKTPGCVFRLMALALQRCRQKGADVVLIAVHPRHARFYEHFFGFGVFGEERPYEMVAGRPAVALSLAFDRLESRHPRAYKRIFSKAFPVETFPRRPVPSYLLAELRAIADETYAADPPQSRTAALIHA